MNVEPPLAPLARLLRSGTFRVDREAGTLSWSPPRHWAQLAVAALAVFFVLLGAIDLDLGPGEARLGLASGERPGPLGQVVGYWAPDLWPAEVLPSYLLAQVEPGGRPTSAAVRWPAALAGILAGWILSRRSARIMGAGTGLFVAVCWFGSIALIDHTGAMGLDFIVGLATLATLNRLMSGGNGWIAGLWASLAFLAGGIPPLLVIALAIVVMGRNTARFSLPLLVLPMVTLVLWSAWTSAAVSPELCASALGLPFTQKPAWSLGIGVFAVALPFSPFAVMPLARSSRTGWTPQARTWMTGWFQAALGSLIAGSLVPGLAAPARAVILAAIALGAAAGLDAAWKQSLSHKAGRTFYILFSVVVASWLCAMMCGTYVWTLCLAYYRVLGFGISLLVVGVGALYWLALAMRRTRYAVAALLLIAIGLKLAYTFYYVPEWNYRYSQGPWARAIAQWVPRRWALYVLHEWPADLEFFTKRTVRQLHSPHFLEHQGDNFSKFVLLLPSEFENWPTSAPPITLVAKFTDQSGGERILARTPGQIPLPPGRNPAWINYLRRSASAPSRDSERR
jgi:hypothetical protein